MNSVFLTICQEIFIQNKMGNLIIILVEINPIAEPHNLIMLPAGPGRNCQAACATPSAT